MKQSILLLFSLLLTGVLVAQPIGKSSYESTLEAGALAFAEKNYYEALEKYQEAFDEREDRALLPIIANLNYLLRDYNRAERTYKRILRRDDENEYVVERYLYGRTLKMNGLYDEAIDYLQQFINLTDNDSLQQVARMELRGAELAQTLPANPQGVTLEILDNEINSPQSEYTPAPTADGNTLYFGSLNATKVVEPNKADPETFVRIYRSQKNEDKWAKAEALGPEINRPGFHSANVSLAPDGRRMYFNRIETGEGNTPVTSTIYMSVEGDDGWKSADVVTGVNGDFLSLHPVVGELFGGEVLFFTSDMPGGYGGLDIYYAPYKGDGVYGDPVNLGATINTAADDVTPWWHDGTLYFSSNGHVGIGGHDIFYSLWDGSSWAEPINMGMTYNTSVDDISFRLDKEGYNGYLVSNRPEGRSVKSKTCCDDIYSFAIPRMYTDLVVGLFDENRKPLVAGTVEVIPVQDGEEREGETKTSSEKSNRFDYGLDFDLDYIVIASKEGYFPDTFQFDTRGLEESKTFEHRFYLKEMPREPDSLTVVISEPIRMENILYDFDSDRIRPEAENDLSFIQELMETYPDMEIELSSHTDARGKDGYNKDLSQRRAESARRWLVRNGVDRTRIAAVGYGEERPQVINQKLANENTFLSVGDTLTEGFINNLINEADRERAHQLNRRTEFEITAGPDSIVIGTKRIEKVDMEDIKDRKSNIGVSAPTQTDPVKIHLLSSLYGQQDLKGVPIMIFPTRVLDLGVVKHGEKRHFDYTFTNRGDTPLQISIISACDCTTTDYSTSKIYQPGESGTIKVTFDSTEKEESETIDVDIYLENEDTAGNPIRETVQYKYTLRK